MTKTCTKCAQEKPFDCFARDKYQSDGLTNSCKECRNAAKTRYRATEHGKAKTAEYNALPKARESRRRWERSPRGKEVRRLLLAKESARIRARAQSRRQYLSMPRVQARAYLRVHYMIGKGRMPRASECLCARCGLQAKEYHHYNGYEGEAALQVVALCKNCHLAYDKIQKCAA